MIRLIIKQFLFSIGPAVLTFFLIYYLQISYLPQHAFAKMDYIWGYSKFICSIIILPFPLLLARAARSGCGLGESVKDSFGIYIGFFALANVFYWTLYNTNIISFYEAWLLILSTIMFSLNQIVASYLVGTGNVISSSVLKTLPQTVFVIFLFYQDIIFSLLYSATVSIVFSFVMYFLVKREISTNAEEYLQKDTNSDKKYITLLMLQINLFLYIDRVLLPHIIPQGLYSIYLNLRYLTTPLFLIGTFLESFFFSRQISVKKIKKISFVITPLLIITTYCILHYLLLYIPEDFTPRVILQHKSDVAFIISTSLIMVPYSIISATFNANAKSGDLRYAVFIIYPTVIISFLLMCYLSVILDSGVKGIVLATVLSYFIRMLFMLRKANGISGGKIDE